MLHERNQSSTTRNILMAAGAGGLLWYGLRKLREQRLQGRTVVITGGSRGLGLLLAREFAREGAAGILLCARDAQELERARQDLQQYGTPVTTFAGDVSDPAKMHELVETATEHFGQVDILINNAGIIMVEPLSAVTREDIERAMDVMFWGVVNSTLAVLSQMLRRGSGQIINITSIGGVVSVPHLMPYNCAKSAAVGFSESITAELAPKGIHVTTVIPGVMRIGSHLNAEFGGNAEREYTWFSLGASLPLLSVKGERAARQITAGIKRRARVVIVGLPAQIASRLHRLFPSISIGVMELVNRLLPTADQAATEHQRGYEIQQGTTSPWFNRLTALGQQAADRNNENGR